MIERYSRKEITKIWEEKNKYQIWLNIEIAAAQTMEKLKLIPKGVASKVRKKAKINVDRIHKIENKVFNISYSYNKEAYEILEKYYKPGRFNNGRKKMAKMPDKASLIYNPSSGAPGFIVENVYCLPGIPSILQSMMNGLKNKIIGGKKILSETISVNTVESEIAKPLEDFQNNFSNVEIGSYPFFRLGKVGVSIVMRSTEKNQLENCTKQIQSFIKQKKIQIIER